MNNRLKTVPTLPSINIIGGLKTKQQSTVATTIDVLCNNLHIVDLPRAYFFVVSFKWASFTYEYEK